MPVYDERVPENAMIDEMTGIYQPSMTMPRVTVLLKSKNVHYKVEIHVHSKHTALARLPTI